MDVGGLKKLVWTPQSIPQSILPRNPKKFKLLDIEPIELARQLTIMDFKMYSSIRPIECLDKSWSRETPPSDGADDAAVVPTAVNIRASIEYCNQITSWVSDAILSQNDIKKRSNLIKFWVQVAEVNLPHQQRLCVLTVLICHRNAANSITLTHVWPFYLLLTIVPWVDSNEHGR
jgi:hypothetical protein